MGNIQDEKLRRIIDKVIYFIWSPSTADEASDEEVSGENCMGKELFFKREGERN